MNKLLDADILCVGSRIYEGRKDWRKRYVGKLCVGVDMLDGDGVDVVMNLETDLLPEEQFTHVECLSVLEHSKKPWVLADNIQRSMKCGATIDLSVPFVWRVHAYPDDYFRFTKAGVESLFPDIHWLELDYVAFHQKVNSAPHMKLDGGKVAYFGKTEVVGFGVRK